MHRVVAHSDVFRAIADPTRRAILDRLRTGPIPVNNIVADFDQSRPAISKHLKILRDASLVAEEKKGRERHYRLSPKPLTEVVDWIDGYRRVWALNLDNLKHYLEQENE